MSKCPFFEKNNSTNNKLVELSKGNSAQHPQRFQAVHSTLLLGIDICLWRIRFSKASSGQGD